MQPVALEYATDRLVEAITREIMEGRPVLLAPAGRTVNHSGANYHGGGCPQRVPENGYQDALMAGDPRCMGLPVERLLGPAAQPAPWEVWPRVGRAQVCRPALAARAHYWAVGESHGLICERQCGEGCARRDQLRGVDACFRGYDIGGSVLHR